MAKKKMKRNNKKLLDTISDASFQRCAKLGLKHAKENKPYIRKTIRELQGKIVSESAIVISAGPSLHIKDPAGLIKKSKYGGLIIAADGAMYYCLRNGIIPDFVVTVDPHPTRIIRLYGDPELKEKPADDYFRRQDLDPAMNIDEIRRNKEIIELVNKYGSQIKLIISTSVTPKISVRAQQAGMELYWWNPIYDDYNEQDSLTKKIYEITGVPCMGTGGNVGTSAWVFSSAVLGIKNIALVGMDLSYHPDTPLEKTQYYHELKEILGDRVQDGYIKIYNPHLKQTWYTDPAYYWYRENFIELSKQTDSETYNCTEGGILFSKEIKFIKLKDFLSNNY